MHALKLNINNWHTFSFDEIFVIKKGKRLATHEQISGDIPYISSSSLNNGVDSYISNGSTDCNCLSYACYGSIGTVFYHPHHVWVSDNCNVLYLQDKELNEDVAMFLIPILELDKYKFSYGMTAKLERIKTFSIKLPCKNNLVDWEYIERIINDMKRHITYPTNNKEINKTPSLSDRKWQQYKLKDIFKMKRGERLTRSSRIAGDIPLVTAGKNNLGVKQYIANESQAKFKDSVTIDMFCNVFYHSDIFCCDDNIVVLKPGDNKINKYVMLFIATVIGKESYRYQYGRQYRQKNFNQHTIKLPSDDNNVPDWQFMEDYIKSLPYSSNL